MNDDIFESLTAKLVAVDTETIRAKCTELGMTCVQPDVAGRLEIGREQMIHWLAACLSLEGWRETFDI